MNTNYKAYAEKMRELLDREEALTRRRGEIQKRRMSKRKKRKELENTDAQLRAVKEEADRVCAMLNELREKEEDKVTKISFFDEEPQEYNEVIGVCYRKAILITDSGKLLWFTCNESSSVCIGDTELDDGLLYPLSELPAGERKMILNYLIEAGSTPIHYINILKEELEK